MRVRRAEQMLNQMVEERRPGGQVRRLHRLAGRRYSRPFMTDALL